MRKRYEKYEDTFCELLGVEFTSSIYKNHIQPLEKEGRSERSICFAIWKSHEKMSQFKNDNRFWGILKNEICKWSWAKDDPRWKLKEEKLAQKKHAEELQIKMARGCAKVSDFEAAGENARLVYFIQGECGGPIKIGYTSNLSSRLSALQTGYPDTLKVLFIIAGTTRREHAIHNMLSEHRLNGEWFKDTPEVRKILEEIKDKYAD